MRAQVSSQIEDVVEIEITGDFKTWVDMAVGRKLKIVAEIIDRQVMDCPKAISKILSLDPAEKVERIRRVRKLKENPVSYYLNYGPSRLLTKLSSRKIEKNTFIETFQDVCKINLKFMEQRVRAASADMDLASILKVDFGFPLFFVQNVYYSEKEIPLVVTHMYYRSDHYVYTAKKNLQ
jgi:DNA-binding GntR family transcriptional regulator